MKTIFTRRVFNTAVVLFGCLMTITSFSQPKFSFQNPTLISGTDRQVNAIYRFPNVSAGIDALVQVQNISSGMSLRSIDRTSDGFGEAFQPEYRVSGISNGYIDFLITFVTTGTSNAVIQSTVDATGLDIDGDNNSGNMLMEYNRIDMGGGTYSFNTTNSHLSVSKTGTAVTGTNITGVLFGALVDTASKQVMFTVSSTNLSSFTYRIGANNLLSNSSTRYASLYFKSFYYPPFPLSLPKLLNFDGISSSNKVQFNWSFASTEELDQCVLERAGSSNMYEPVANFLYTGEDAPGTHATYTDYLSVSGAYYYRLKMIGKDGEVKYSSILAFKTGNEKAIQNLVVYPSIITDRFTVKLNAEKNESARLEMVDYSGRQVYSRAINLKQGENNISVNDFAAQRGNFVIVVRSASKVHSQKIIVQ